jgi:RNA recognition motif-containing protein
MNRVMHLEIKKRKLFVRRLGKNIDEEILRNYFQQFGEVESVSVLRSFKTKQSRRVGHVIFTNFQGATNAIEFQGEHVIEGKKIEVEQCLLADEIKS